MKQNILKCSNCGAYTLKQECSICKNKTINPKPQRFSLEDKFGYWRRKAKKE